MALACLAPSSRPAAVPRSLRRRGPMSSQEQRAWTAGGTPRQHCRHRRRQLLLQATAEVRGLEASSLASATPGPFVLRDYQQDAVAAIMEALGRGVTSQLVSLPTGSGKTVVFCHLARLLGWRTLVLAHRTELLQQTADTMRALWPEAAVGILNQQRRQIDAQVVVASVQTAVRQKTLQQLVAQGFELIIVDEAHHAVARSYTNILSSLGPGSTCSSDEDELPAAAGQRAAGAPGSLQLQLPNLEGPSGCEPSLANESANESGTESEGEALQELAGSARLMVGFTATPYRLDGLALGQVFQEVVYQRDMRYMVGRRVLALPLGYRVLTEEDLSGARETRSGDFRERELEVLVNTPGRNTQTACAYKTLAAGRQAIAFCVGIQHALDLASAFRAEGVACEAVHGQMSAAERERVLRRFAAGELQVLTNCMILTEGFDMAGVACVIMARPTKSTGLFVQCVGRGLRPRQGKPDCLVLDMTDRHHDLNAVASLEGVYCSQEEGSALGAQLAPARPPPLPRDDTVKVNLAAALPRGKIELLAPRYTWTRFADTPHFLLKLFTPDQEAQRWLWLVACRPLLPSEAERQAEQRAKEAEQARQAEQAQAAAQARRRRLSAARGGLQSKALRAVRDSLRTAEDAIDYSVYAELPEGPDGRPLRYTVQLMVQEGDAFSWRMAGHRAGRRSRLAPQGPAPLAAAICWAEALIQDDFKLHARRSWTGPATSQQLQQLVEALPPRDWQALARRLQREERPLGFGEAAGLLGLAEAAEHYNAGRFDIPTFYC